MPDLKKPAKVLYLFYLKSLYPAFLMLKKMPKVT